MTTAESLERRLLLCAFVSVLALAHGLNVPCDLREAKYGQVCVCNATYCDYMEEPVLGGDTDFTLISSSKAGLRFAVTNGSFDPLVKYQIRDYGGQTEDSVQSKATPTRRVHLSIDRSKVYQKIVGIGGSFTGAVSYLLDALPAELQDHLYKSYHAEDGIGFNLMRMSIGGCDFDLAPWAYNELPVNDEHLTNFTELDARDLQKVKQIQRLKEVSKVKNLRIKGAAWSPPPWMKTNSRWTGLSRLKKEYYQTWANYHLKWLELMAEHDLPIWAISTGNEPTNGVAFMFFVRFVSLGWTPKSQANWLVDNLGPTIRNSKYKDVIIFSNDDQTFTFPYWFRQMNATRRNSLDYLDGLSVHWYWNEIFGHKSTFDKALAEMPDKILISSESCIGDKPWQKAAPLLGSWERGEKMARAFLAGFQHGFNGWIDWNLILDEKGGPNYVDNTVDAPIVVNMTNPAEFFKQPMFYTIGHFSKFVPEDSLRIAVDRSNVNVDSAAFLRPDGSISAVLFNSGNANLEVAVEDSVRGSVTLNLPPRSIHTLIYK